MSLLICLLAGCGVVGVCYGIYYLFDNEDIQ